MQAKPAADGWGGGLYRAWTDGKNAAVLLRTRWATDRDATEFAKAIGDWIGPGQSASVTTTGSNVDVLFASNAATLAKLKAAAGR